MNRPFPRRAIGSALVSAAALSIALNAAAQTAMIDGPPADPQVRSSIVTGTGQLPVPPRTQTFEPRPGDIALNFPGSDVRVVAQAVLGDILGLPFTVAPSASGQVTLVTPRKVARGSVLELFEEALRVSRLALVRQNGGYTVMSVDAARASGAAGAGEGRPGFGNEIERLEFVSAVQMKALLDPILPGVVVLADPVANTLTLAGTEGQRANARAILKQFDVNWLRNMSFALFVPQRTDARIIVPELDKLINAADSPTRGLVRLIAMENLNGILAVSAQSQYLADVNRWIEILDREGQNNEERMFVYRVQNGRSKDLARTLNTAFGMSDGAAGGNSADRPSSGLPASDGSVQTAPSSQQPAPGGAISSAGGTGRARIGATITNDDNNNAIVVFGTPREYAIVLEALRKLDIAPMQVLIEAAITEVSLNDNLSYGLQWNFTGSSGSNTFNGTQTDSAGSLALARQSPGFSLLFTHGQSISAVLNTLETKTKINVVSAPKLVVLNNQTAALQVGDQVPILTQSSTSNIGNSATVNSVDYRDTGVILKITPRVNESGLVTLDIAQEVSSVKNTNSSGINSPTISTRKISTTVAVQDGDVVALGGLIRNTLSVDRNGIPVVSQIPILGALFGNHGRTRDKTELIVLIKTRVIRSSDEAQTMTQELQSRIQIEPPEKPSRRGRKGANTPEPATIP
ncbi:MAG: type II secretion system secretin GspD [Novosphingobium sp.]